MGESSVNVHCLLKANRAACTCAGASEITCVIGCVPTVVKISPVIKTDCTVLYCFILCFTVFFTELYCSILCFSVMYCSAM